MKIKESEKMANVGTEVTISRQGNLSLFEFQHPDSDREGSVQPASTRALPGWVGGAAQWPGPGFDPLHLRTKKQSWKRVGTVTDEQHARQAPPTSPESWLSQTLIPLGEAQLHSQGPASVPIHHTKRPAGAGSPAQGRVCASQTQGPGFNPQRKIQMNMEYEFCGQ